MPRFGSSLCLVRPKVFNHTSIKIADGFPAWVTSRLERQSESRQAGSAALILTYIEGMYLLKAIGSGGLAGSAMTELAAHRRH